MLKTEKRRVKIGSDGLLHLEMPAGIANTEIEIEFAWEPVQTKKVDENGWPLGFFDQYQIDVAALGRVRRQR